MIALRPDLEIIPGPQDPSGAPTWLVHDPLNNRYTRIGWLDHEIISRWSLGTPDVIAADIREQTTLDAETTDVEKLYQHLGEADLLMHVSMQAPTTIAAWKKFGMWRIPLVCPNPFLDKTLWLPRAVMSKVGRLLLLMIFVWTIIHIFQNFDEFTASVRQLLNPAAVPQLLFVLIGIKVFHELGHAWACRAKGLDVPSVGIAIFMIWPFMYTDTTAAWRLTSRHDRAFVGAAGVLSEIVVAIIALALWCVVPDGFVRSSLLFASTSSLALSLLINANPFMRWDGYYVAADLTGIENLQPRAFLLSKWWAMRALFGIQDPVPETFPRIVERRLIIYGVATWAYRVLLYVGMAAILYAMLFKVAGLLLMAFVVFRFLVFPSIEMLMPVMKSPGRLRPTPLNLGLIAAAVATWFALTLPLKTTVTSTALVKPADVPSVFVRDPGRVVDNFLEEGKWYDNGDTLITLDSTDIDRTLELAKVELKAIDLKLKSDQGASGSSERTILVEQRKRQTVLINALTERLSDQKIVAPVSGYAVQVASSHKSGSWINSSQVLARLTNFDDVEVITYVDHRDQLRLTTGSKAKLIPDDPALDPIELTVSAIQPAATSQITAPDLLDHLGGHVKTTVAADGNRQLKGAWYEVVLTPAQDSEQSDSTSVRTVRGALIVEAEPVSVLKPVFASLSNTIKTALAF